jgi:hypothetical protein
MKHLNVVLVLFLAILLVAGSAFAACDLTPSSEGVPFTYNQTWSDPTMGNRQTRLFEFRVGGVISATDAQMLLDAADLGHLDPDPDGNDEATLWLKTEIDNVVEILTGDCEGVVMKRANRLLGYMLVINSAGRMELPIFAILTDGEASSPPIEAGAQINVEMEQDSKKMKFKSEVKSADGQFHINTEIEIPADAEFILSSLDYYKLNIPFWLATSPNFTTDPLWAASHEMRYDVKPGDKVKIKTRKNEGLVCFNQLIKATGEDVCVTILRAEGGRVMRRTETYTGWGLE